MELINAFDNYIHNALCDYIKAENIDGWLYINDYRNIPFIWKDSLEELKAVSEQLIEDQKKYIDRKVGRRR